MFRWVNILTDIEWQFNLRYSIKEVSMVRVLLIIKEWSRVL